MRTYKEIETWFKQQSWYGKYKEYYSKAHKYNEFKITDIPWYGDNLPHPFGIEMFAWSSTNEGVSFWEKAWRNFEEWFKEGTSPDPRTTPAKPDKPNPKTFSMVKRKDKKYKLKYRV